MGETLEFEQAYYWQKYVSKQYPEDGELIRELERVDPDPKRETMAYEYLTLVHHAGIDQCFCCNAPINFNVETLWVLRLHPETVYCERCYQKNKDFTAFLHKFNLLTMLYKE